MSQKNIYIEYHHSAKKVEITVAPYGPALGEQRQLQVVLSRCTFMSASVSDPSGVGSEGSSALTSSLESPVCSAQLLRSCVTFWA